MEEPTLFTYFKQDNSRLSILDLPQELRDQIYHYYYAYEPVNVHLVDTESPSAPWKPASLTSDHEAPRWEAAYSLLRDPKEPKRPSAQTSLARSCRLIWSELHRYEASPQNVRIVTSPLYDSPWDEAEATKKGVSQRDMVRISLANVETLTVPEHMAGLLYGDAACPTRRPLLRLIDTHMPNLHKLTVDYPWRAMDRQGHLRMREAVSPFSKHNTVFASPSTKVLLEAWSTAADWRAHRWEEKQTPVAEARCVSRVVCPASFDTVPESLETIVLRILVQPKELGRCINSKCALGRDQKLVPVKKERDQLAVFRLVGGGAEANESEVAEIRPSETKKKSSKAQARSRFRRGKASNPTPMRKEADVDPGIV